jgi:hypothetical protein
MTSHEANVLLLRGYKWKDERLINYIEKNSDKLNSNTMCQFMYKLITVNKWNISNKLISMEYVDFSAVNYFINHIGSYQINLTIKKLSALNKAVMDRFDMDIVHSIYYDKYEVVDKHNRRRYRTQPKVITIITEKILANRRIGIWIIKYCIKYNKIEALKSVSNIIDSFGDDKRDLSELYWFHIKDIIQKKKNMTTKEFYFHCRNSMYLKIKMYYDELKEIHKTNKANRNIFDVDGAITAYRYILERDELDIAFMFVDDYITEIGYDIAIYEAIARKRIDIVKRLIYGYGSYKPYEGYKLCKQNVSVYLFAACILSNDLDVLNEVSTIFKDKWMIDIMAFEENWKNISNKTMCDRSISVNNVIMCDDVTRISDSIITNKLTNMYSFAMDIEGYNIVPIIPKNKWGKYSHSMNLACHFRFCIENRLYDEFEMLCSHNIDKEKDTVTNFLGYEHMAYYREHKFDIERIVNITKKYTDFDIFLPADYAQYQLLHEIARYGTAESVDWFIHQLVNAGMDFDIGFNDLVYFQAALSTENAGTLRKLFEYAYLTGATINDTDMIIDYITQNWSVSCQCKNTDLEKCNIVKILNIITDYYKKIGCYFDIGACNDNLFKRITHWEHWIVIDWIMKRTNSYKVIWCQTIDGNKEIKKWCIINPLNDVYKLVANNKMQTIHKLYPYIEVDKDNGIYCPICLLEPDDIAMKYCDRDHYMCLKCCHSYFGSKSSVKCLDCNSIQNDKFSIVFFKVKAE